MSTSHDTARTKWGTVFESSESTLGSVVISGYGFTGSRLVARLIDDCRRVSVLVREGTSARNAQRSGADVISADFDDSASVSKTSVSMVLKGATLFHLVPPSLNGSKDSRLRTLLQANRLFPPARIVLVSTTGVYGDHSGALIDECTPVDPGSDRAVRRVDAECAAREFADTAGCELVILRVAGIYGPGRLPLERLRRADPLPPMQQCGYTNRIHVEDLVTVLVAAAQRGEHGAVFNVSDGNPMRMRAWFECVARAAGLEPPPLVSPDQAEDQLSPMLLSFLSQSRQLDNSLMLEKLGVTLRFSNVDDGIANALGRD